MSTLIDERTSAPTTAESPGDIRSDEAPRIIREITDDGVVVLTFDNPKGPANIFDLTTLGELSEHLSWVAVQPDLKGLILKSSKPAIFIAGADISALQSLPEEELKLFLAKGQETFSQIAQLSIPTVAAIHGACMGGGLEVALACDWRTASDSSATSLGLPETQLGILPAWGGSTRLPKLIGLSKALGLILPGKRLNAKKARRLGVVDTVVHPEHLFAEAQDLLKRGKRTLKSHWKENNLVSAAIIRRITERKLLKSTGGHYPAPLAALEVVSLAVRSDEANSLRREREAIMELAQTPAAKNLIRTFMLQQRSKKVRHDASVSPKPEKIERTAVIGAGVMGAGIAQWISSRGTPVVMQDIDEERVAAGLKTIRKLYQGGVSRRLFTEHEAEEKLELVAPAAHPVILTNQDLVIEAAVEDLGIKTKIFRDLSQRTRPDTILATNTSALPISELAEDPEISNPERILGLHFFNPVHRMKLVEVVVTEHTSAEAVESALAFVKSIGKMPVIVKDSPGFLVNRILMPYLIMAGRLYGKGVDPKVIDDSMLKFGMPMGPLRLLDEVGLDVALHVSKTMEAAFGNRLHTPKILRLLVDNGHLGRKSGSGFYVYGDKKSAPEVNELAMKHRSLANRVDVGADVLRDLLPLIMVDEAARCLEEGVVDAPEDVDFAMIMGTGWAPFRGGPLRYADDLGTAKALEALERASEACKEPLTPSKRLRDLAASGDTFYPGRA